MGTQNLHKAATKYFKRFADPKALLDQSIDPSCKVIIVIPCHNEPDLLGTLESLLDCKPVNYHIEVIVIVNDAEDSEESEVRNQNLTTINEFHDWVQNPKPQIPNLKFQIIESLDLPKKTAGVGLARKIGMDEALRRFISIGYDGTIVCLDADCRVSDTYLRAIDLEFVQTNAGVGVMTFEHQYQIETNEALKNGIINYELFLRYYVEGLRQSQFPHAIHTIGSCMLVKASVYAKHGGMNKKKAGEDFYFLQKIVPHEKFITVKGGVVYPSCRTSDRVPFGTGKAQNDWLNQKDQAYLTYDPMVFKDLKKVNESINDLFQMNLQQWLSKQPSTFISFFKKNRLETKIEAIKANCKNLEQFKKQFYIWFDGFMCMKFVHFVRDHFYANISLVRAASSLLNTQTSVLPELLSRYREIDMIH